MAERSGSVLQMNEELDVSSHTGSYLNDAKSITFIQTTETFDVFLAAQKEGRPNAVRMLEPLRLRYFSPSELLRIFSFGPCTADGDLDFIWPTSISTKTKYKLIGNSVNVTVVTRLIEYLLQ